MSFIFKIAYYRKNDWEKLLTIADDREALDDTWEEWLIGYNNLQEHLKKEGFTVHRMTIDIEKLQQYCAKRGLKNDSKTRSKYVNTLPLNQEK